ncbi:hypothetical protein B0H12DRAFT_1132600, partial [Mycena haematopus]
LLTIFLGFILGNHLSKSWDHITQLGTLWQCGECPKIMHCICGISPEHNALS